MADTQRGFNINTFRAALNGDQIARPNLFLVEFSVPPGLAGQSAALATAKVLEYWCEVAAIPDAGFNTYQSPRYGYGNFETRPTLNIFADISIDVYFDESAFNWRFFADWMNLICNRNGSDGPVGVAGINGALQNELEYKDQYVADIGIYTFDALGQNIGHWILRDAFPKSLGSIRLAWAETNSIMRLPMTFAYNDWYTQKPTEKTTPQPLK